MVNNKEPQKNTEFITPTELARILGISRTAIHKRIKKGEIPVKKIGRNFGIPVDAIGGITRQGVSEQKKEEINKAVHKTVKEYGETLRLLGKE